MKPDKPLSAWLAPGANPFGQPHQHDYGKILECSTGGSRALAQNFYLSNLAAGQQLQSSFVIREWQSRADLN